MTIMKNEKSAQRALAVLDGWLSAPRTDEGLQGDSKVMMQGYLACIAKVKQIIESEYEEAE